MEAYFYHLVVLGGVYIVLTQSLDLISGHTGLMSIAHSALFGIGAYGVAIFYGQMHYPFIVAWLIGMVLAGMAGLMVGLPSLRLRGDYFVIATFALQVLCFNFMNNVSNVTGGALGITGIPTPWFMSTTARAALVCSSLALLFSFIKWVLTRSPFGRVLNCIREDEDLVMALGRNPVGFKIAAFMISAVMAAAAGGIYAAYVSFVDPTTFTIMDSIAILCAVIIGGSGSTAGPVFGALILIGLPEILRFVGLPYSVASNVRQIIYGMLLVLILMFRPGGVVGGFSFDIREHTRL